ncbi:MAG: hypothetical protein M5F18_11650 [Asgard group archaeon]|nr:hypothetical protein [Asgard group archaeon]
MIDLFIGLLDGDPVDVELELELPVKHPSPRNISSLSALTSFSDSAAVKGRTRTATDIEDCLALGTDGVILDSVSKLLLLDIT